MFEKKGLGCFLLVARVLIRGGVCTSIYRTDSCAHEYSLYLHGFVLCLRVLSVLSTERDLAPRVASNLT